MLARAYPRNY